MEEDLLVELDSTVLFPLRKIKASLLGEDGVTK